MNLLDAVDVYVDDAEAAPGGAPVRAGTLRASFQGGRTLAGSSFEYTPAYLAYDARYPLSPDLPLVPGRQYTGEDQRLFGAFSDVAPDDWGSALIDEAYSKERGDGQPSAIGAFDHLVQINDATRMGALRFTPHAPWGQRGADPQAHTDDQWLTPDDHTRARLSDVRSLAAAAARFEVYEATDEDLELLGVAGSSLGGARPKVTLRMDDGTLWMLKLPSNRDRRADIEAWEAVALELARRAGIQVPAHRLVPIQDYNSSLLIQRFDREPHATGTVPRRVAYISAMTAMGVGLQQQDRATYEDLADAIDQLSASTADLREMFSRVALSVMIGNIDDHWKNHGFIRRGGRWRLSPAFDINPSRPSGKLRGRSLSARDGAGERDIRVLMEGADAYALSKADAAAALSPIVSAVERWRQVAQSFGIAPAEIQHMAPAFSETQVDHAKAFLSSYSVR